MDAENDQVHAKPFVVVDDLLGDDLGRRAGGRGREPRTDPLRRGRRGAAAAATAAATAFDGERGGADVGRARLAGAAGGMARAWVPAGRRAVGTAVFFRTVNKKC